jgi:hypothetical protein
MRGADLWSISDAYSSNNESVDNNYIVITTHRSYTIALDALLETLAAWPKERIIIVYSGEPSNTTEIRNRMTVVKITNNIYEYGGFFVPLLLDIPDGTFLLLHDTCKAGPNFAKKAERYFEDFKESSTDVLWFSRTGQCNLCMFNHKVSTAAYGKWSAWSTLDKTKAINMEHDLGHPDGLKSDTTLSQVFVDCNQQTQGPVTPYVNNAVREALYFPCIDIVKYYFVIHADGVHPQRP